MLSVKYILDAREAAATIARLALISLVITVGTSSEVCATNRIDIDISEQGASSPVDTLFADSAYEFRVWIENDYQLGGMSLGFQVWSPDGAGWRWRDVGGLGDITSCVTMVPGSRLVNGAYEDSSCWDFGGLYMNEQNIDETGRDSIMCGGLAMLSPGMAPGPLEHMYSYHFIPDVPAEYGLFTLCIDSCFVPPAGPFIFCDAPFCESQPLISWDNGGKCWTVTSGKELPSYCDPVFPVCPGGDAPFQVYLRDNFGDPVVGDTSVWVEFVNCDIIQPCPGSSQSFTTLRPVGPSDENGMVRFYMSGGGCDNDCYAVVKTPAFTIGSVPVKSFDIDGSFTVSIKNDFDYSLCNDYNNDGLINYNDDNLFMAHAGHSCEIDPCEMFGYRFSLNPESNLLPGQQIMLELQLDNNNAAESCYVGLVGFFHSPYGTGTEQTLIENVPLSDFLSPGEQALISVPYIIPPEGHGCVHAKFTTDCCSTAVELTRCFQSTQHCRPGENVCYQFHLALDSVPVLDTAWRLTMPEGWMMDILSSPGFPLYSPDTLIYQICTPNLSDLGDSSSVIFAACYEEGCEGDPDEFETRVVITSRTGDTNSDCVINIADAVYLIQYIFKGGPPPDNTDAGDTNCDGSLNVADAVYIINYIFKGGDPPCYAD